MSNEVFLRQKLDYEEDYQPTARLRNDLRQGLLITAFVVFGLGGLAAFIPMAGAVIAPGTVSVATFVKEISHPTGGVISEILVNDGMRVIEGQPLIRLDDTVSGASATYTGENVDQLLARLARLAAIRDNLSSPPFPMELTRRSNDPVVAALMREESRTLELDRQAQQGQIAQLNKQIAQTRAEIQGYNSQASSYSTQAKLIDQELEATRDLYEQRYTTLDRLNALERSASSLLANAQSAHSSATSATARIGQLQAQVASVGQEARRAAAAQYLDVQSRISELRQTKAGADENFERSVIRAPQSGIVDKLAIRTIGGVLPAGEVVIEIVPDKDQLVVNVQVPVTDIDQVREGQKAMLRFSSFSVRTTPEIMGTVTFVSADRTVESQIGIAYYRARIEISNSELAKLGNLSLRPGMPVETFIQTGERTMLSYIIKPLSDQIKRAFREN